MDLFWTWPVLLVLGSLKSDTKSKPASPEPSGGEKVTSLHSQTMLCQDASARFSLGYHWPLPWGYIAGWLSSNSPDLSRLSLHSWFPAGGSPAYAGVISSQAQDFALLLAELHETPVRPSLPPDESLWPPALASVTSFQFGIICKLAKVS